MKETHLHIGTLADNPSYGMTVVNIAVPYIKESLRIVSKAREECGHSLPVWDRIVMEFVWKAASSPLSLFDENTRLSVKADLVWLLERKGKLKEAIRRRHKSVALVGFVPGIDICDVTVGFVPLSLLSKPHANDNSLKEMLMK